MGLLLALWRVVPQHLRRRRRDGTPGWWWLLRLRVGRGCREQLGLFRRLLLAVLAVRFANYPEAGSGDGDGGGAVSAASSTRQSSSSRCRHRLIS